MRRLMRCELWPFTHGRECNITERFSRPARDKERRIGEASRTVADSLLSSRELTTLRARRDVDEGLSLER